MNDQTMSRESIQIAWPENVKSDSAAEFLPGARPGG